MATFTIPQTRVQYAGWGDYFNTKYFNAYWGATVTGDYTYSPAYALIISKVAFTVKYTCHTTIPGAAFYINGISRVSLTLYAKDSSGSNFASVNMSASVSGGEGYVKKGDSFTYKGTWTGSRTLSLPNSGGSLRGLLLCDGSDHGMIYATPHFPSYTPNTPGVQYRTSSGWRTVLIKRHNGSYFYDIPAKVYKGSWRDTIG